MSRPTNEILPAEIVESQSWQLTLGSIVGVLVLVFVVNLVAVWILQQDNTDGGHTFKGGVLETAEPSRRV